MSYMLDAVRSVSFISPFLLLTILPLFYLLLGGSLPLIGHFLRPRRVKIAALRDLRRVGRGTLFVKAFHMTLLFIIVVLAGALIAGPVVDRSHAATTHTTIQPLRTIVVVFDISSSMNDSQLGGGQSRFHVARDAFVVFLTEQSDMRVGVIFFAKMAFEYRRPTSDLKALAKDIRRLEISGSASIRKELGDLQLARIPNRYSTRAVSGLELVVPVIWSVPPPNHPENSAVIFITDLEDNQNVEGAAQAVRELIDAGVRVYVLHIHETSASYNADLQKLLSENPSVRIFSIHSVDDVRDAYEEISTLESSPIVVQETIPAAKRSISAEVALLLIGAVGFFIVSSEILWPRLRKGG